MVLLRRAGPINIDGRKYDRTWLDNRIAASRDPNKNLDSDLKATVVKKSPKKEVRRRLDSISQLEAQTRLEEGLKMLKRGPLANFKPLLPLLLSIKGEPYHLGDHFTFEPFFSTMMSRRLVYKTGRQVAKSTSMAAQGIIQSNTIPFFNTLYVTPRYETVRRFSSNYVRGFIEQSPVRSLLIDSSCTNSVLQRSFRNNSTMFFSFAYLDCDRTRGLNTDKTAYDEVQDLMPEFIPIIRETMSGSRRGGYELFTGTPKTLEGTLETLWSDSSQAEWHIKCKACGKENIPTLAYDLDAMTGPSVVTREISEDMPGCVCAKCGRPIYPRDGHWVHHYPQARLDFAGYHVPQLIMPMHFSDPEKWAVLLGKRDGFGNTAEYMYYNEVCGESFDSGAKMITKTELIAACDNRPNDLEYASSIAGNYLQRVISVDWGGGGQDMVSFTVVSVLGIRADGRIDVLYAHRFRSMHAYAQEAHAILYIMGKCRCSYVVHDFGGRGDIREHLLINAGLSREQIIPMAYIGPAVGEIVHYKAENTETGQRMYYQCDKARSLVLTCELIRYNRLRFFEYDHKGSEHAGLLHDFLALIEDTVESPTRSHLMKIIRDEKVGPDDFAHSVNIGCMALFHLRGEYPDLAMAAKIAVDPRIIEQLHPVQPNWDMF